MAGVLDSVLNAAPLYALKHRLDAMRAATAEEENTKRFLAERLNMGTAGQPIDVGGLPSASVLASMYDEQQLRDRSGAIAQERRNKAQGAADQLVQKGMLRYVEPKQVAEWLSLGVDIPPDQLPQDMMNPDPAMLQTAYGGALGPEQAQAFGNLPWSIAKTMLGNVPIQTKAPAASVDQLDAIPEFATLSPEHQNAARAVVRATGKMPSQEFWTGALAPRDSGGPDTYSEKQIQAGLAAKVLTQRDADVLRAAGGRAAVGNEMFRNAGERKQFDTARERLLKFRFDNAQNALGVAQKNREMALNPASTFGNTEKAAAIQAAQAAQQAVEQAKNELDSFYAGQSAPSTSEQTDQGGADIRSQMVNLAKSMREQGMNEETIKAQLRKRFGKGQQ